MNLLPRRNIARPALSLHRIGAARLALIAALAFVSFSPRLCAQTPNADDLVWQKAVANYAPQRQHWTDAIEQKDRLGPFQPTWDSLKGYQIPAWYEDAKFGIFIHWGAYSVPAFGSEWYPRLMYLEGTPEFKHHVATYGPPSKFGYKDFIPQFRAEKFNAAEWAQLFRESGAKYVIPVAEHHDGFPMYASELTDWSAAKMGPHRDVIGELAAAIRKEGLHFGASTHRAEHYFFLNGGRAFDSDVRDPRFAAFYGPAHAGVKDPGWDAHPDPAYLDDWLARCGELTLKYQPDLLYFDWWMEKPEFAPYLQKLIAAYYNDAASRKLTPVVFYKNSALPEGTAVLDFERGQLEAVRPVHWQTDTSISDKSWGYVEGDTYKSPESIVWQLVDIVSKNGNLLLNIGPKSDGTIPPQASDVLRKIGAWLQVNGEAIYGTRPWKTFGEGPTKVVGGPFHDTQTQPFTPEDVRFTTRGANLYAIAMGWPKSGKLMVHSLGKNSGVQINDVALLGSGAKITWWQSAEGLSLTLPEKPPGSYAFSFRIAMKP